MTHVNKFNIPHILVHSLGPIYYRNSQGAILVYDIGSEESFVKIQKWIRELRSIVGEDIVCVIVGNKCDLLKDRKINYDLKKHEDYAESVGARHFLASAKLNENIDEIFLEISKDMIKKSKQNAPNSSSLNRSGSMRRQLRIEDTSPQAEEALGVGEPANSKCCR